MEQKKPPFEGDAKELAEMMGPGRMSIEDKEAFLLAHGHKFFLNNDFVNKGTYEELFKRLDLNGKTIVNVGAGFSISPYSTTGSGLDVTPMIEALNEQDPNCTLALLDYNHLRTTSWLMLDTHQSAKNNNVHLEPVTGDAKALPFADGSLDGYLSSNLINEPREMESELSFVKKMLAEAYRVLKPGGFLMVSSFGYFWWQLEDGTIIYNDNVDIEEIVTEEMVKKLIQDAGFSSVSPVPLDEKQITEAVKARSARKNGAVECGVRDQCAFIAIK